LANFLEPGFNWGKNPITKDLIGNQGLVKELKAKRKVIGNFTPKLGRIRNLVKNF